MVATAVPLLGATHRCTLSAPVPPQVPELVEVPFTPDLISPPAGAKSMGELQVPSGGDMRST